MENYFKIICDYGAKVTDWYDILLANDHIYYSKQKYLPLPNILKKLTVTGNCKRLCVMKHHSFFLSKLATYFYFLSIGKVQKDIRSCLLKKQFTNETRTNAIIACITTFS